MTFLQPSLLWLLPLAVLPVVIHLLNRMRFRTVHWAATSFLLSANRASTRHARLRQLLLLACRVLALLALILAVARPLAGGWAGWMLSSAPDAVLVLLDRSASMETQDDAATGAARRQKALQAIASAASAYGDRTRCILFENVFRRPQEVARPSLLPGLPNAGPTDTGADMPALFDAAANWLQQNRPGLAEIWIASDLQRSNWQPGSARWQAISARLGALPGTVHVRLLAVPGQSGPNASVTLVSAWRRARQNPPMIELTFDIQRSDASAGTMPVSITLDAARTHLDVPVQGATTRVHHLLPLDPSRESGYGVVEIPPDGNNRDNTAWFVYAPPPLLRVALIGTDNRYLRCAADPFPGDQKMSCEPVEQPPDDPDFFGRFACVLWNGPLPAGPVATRLESYAKSGGAVVFFPPAPGIEHPGSFAGAAWGDLKEERTRVATWDRQDGPLADTEGGTSLAVDSVEILRSRPIVSGGEIRAALGGNGNQPMLTERVLGKGRIWFCGTLPDPQWSNLGDGRVLVPMIQRMVEQGAKRLAAGSFLETGDASLFDNAAEWTAVAPAAPRDIRFQAGVYRNGPRLVAVNRPADEDDPDRMDAGAARRLFAPLKVELFQEHGAGGLETLQGEIWRALLFGMLILLMAEGYLSLPREGRDAPALAVKPQAPSRREPELAGAGRA